MKCWPFDRTPAAGVSGSVSNTSVLEGAGLAIEHALERAEIVDFAERVLSPIVRLPDCPIESAAGFFEAEARRGFHQLLPRNLAVESIDCQVRVHVAALAMLARGSSADPVRG